jgi:hypothetical protein
MPAATRPVPIHRTIAAAGRSRSLGCVLTVPESITSRLSEMTRQPDRLRAPQFNPNSLS